MTNMKHLFFLAAFIFVSCSLSKQINNKQMTDNIYKVYKIDSVHSYYLVYAKRGDTLYKIVSKKQWQRNSNKIYVGGQYDFLLHSVWHQKIMIGNVDVSPSNMPHITCMNFDDSTAICLEKDSINDLFIASNLKGLFILKQRQ